MKKALLFILTIALCHTSMTAQTKREFRGAWIQAVNGQWTGMGRDQMQKTLTYQLDELQKDGVNAIFFQVRPECDALYQSSIEPWSRFLTARQGQAPSPYWDPLQWITEQCHKRGMELHAWINPYRAKTKTTNELIDNLLNSSLVRNTTCDAFWNELLCLLHATLEVTVSRTLLHSLKRTHTTV